VQTEVLLHMHDGPAGYRQFVEGEQAPSSESAVLDWAIRTAIAESAADDFITQGLERSVAAALLRCTGTAVARAAGDLVVHRTPDARRQAARRAARRVETDPRFAALVTRANKLAA
jgi:hypothetical protein